MHCRNVRKQASDKCPTVLRLVFRRINLDSSTLYQAQRNRPFRVAQLQHPV